MALNRKTFAVIATLFTGIALVFALPQSRGPAAQQAPLPGHLLQRPDVITFRVVFGYQRGAPKRYDGTVSTSGGTIRTIEPWRFLDGDSITPPDPNTPWWAWKLQFRRVVFENQPDAPNSMAGGPQPQNLVPAGLFVTVDSAAADARFHTVQGDFTVITRDVTYGRDLWFLDGDVQVQRVPTASQVSAQKTEEHDYPSIAVTHDGAVWTAWQAYQDRGDNVYVRRHGGDAERLTTAKGDIFRTSIAEDADGRIHAAWSEREGAAWNLYERIYDGRSWSSRAQITRANFPNIFHKLVADSRGPRRLSLIWVGYENGESYLYTSSYTRAGGWSAPVRAGGPSVWAPDGAYDPTGILHLAWDSYQNGNYDVFYRAISADGTLAPVEQITKSPGFDAHPSLAIDGQGRPWLAWDQSGANWGKDWTHDDQNRSTIIYKDRAINVIVKDAGVWKEAPDLAAAVPDRIKRYWQLPHLAWAAGRMWMLFQIRTSAAVQRIDYWSAGGMWDLYLATIDKGVWQPAAIVPHSTSRNEAAFQAAPAAGGIWMTWTTDSRTVRDSNANYQAPTMVHYDVWNASASADPSGGVPTLVAYNERIGGNPQVMHPNEREDVRRIRAYRTTVAGAEYRILRGDFHRHTDISNDGSGDGSLEDFYRYMIDAAAMDTGIVTDHNMGGDVEYNWWRTEKSYDLFLIPGRYTPLFGYERSVNYPNGHRNVVFDHRGVRTLPVGQAENQGRVNSGSLVYPYLRQNRGICMEHSLATGQGTDWRDNDPDLEPLVEIYQGYHAAYEYEGGPRAESAANHLVVHGSYEPLGFYWNALAKGLKLGVEASSDHISTHVSYTLIYSPSATDRTAIVDSMRRRHAYAATDNIVVDFQAVDTDGATHMMGDIFTASRGLRLRFKTMGTDTIDKIELIRNQAVVYSVPNSGKKEAEFEYSDMSPQPGTNWYYVRVTQVDRNLAWGSPVWVTYR